MVVNVTKVLGTLINTNTIIINMTFGPNFSSNFNIAQAVAKFNVCQQFINLSNDGYKPLACKPLTAVTVDDIGEHGLANAYKFFFLAKRNTIRESATLDVILPIPNFIRMKRISLR